MRILSPGEWRVSLNSRMMRMMLKNSRMSVAHQMFFDVHTSVQSLVEVTLFTYLLTQGHLR